MVNSRHGEQKWRWTSTQIRSQSYQLSPDKTLVPNSLTIRMISDGIQPNQQSLRLTFHWDHHGRVTAAIRPPSKQCSWLPPALLWHVRISSPLSSTENTHKVYFWLRICQVTKTCPGESRGKCQYLTSWETQSVSNALSISSAFTSR